MAEDLSQNSGDVANDDGKDKHDAFALCGAGADALVNGNRPGNTKAKEHNEFKYLHKYTFLSLTIISLTIDNVKYIIIMKTIGKSYDRRRSMDLQKLRYFHTTAQLEHITRSAEILHISQPSLTQAIHSLEKEYGVELFAREGRKVVLTDAGKYLKTRLDTLLPEFDHLATEMEELKVSETKTVRLNILAASTFVINTLMEYKTLHPDVIFEFEQNELKHNCDILITTNGLDPGEKSRNLQRFVKKEEIFLAVPKDSEYAKTQEVELKSVKDESFVMLSNTRLFGAICNEFCSVAGFYPKIIFESDSPTAVQNIISMGAGIAFWPEHSWGRLHNENLTLLRISSPICRRDLIVELHERHPKSVYAEAFYNFLIEKL